jgi:hypothetical protein
MTAARLTLPSLLVVAVTAVGCGSSSSDAAAQGPLEGTWRVSISAEEVRAAGHPNGMGWSGTWTLTIDGESFTLACTPVDQPGVDCGNHPDPASVEALEAGSVTIDDDTVTFSTDEDALAAITDCVPTGGAGDGEPCPTDVTYPATFAVDGDTATFADSEAVLLVVTPWQRID